ncbi:MAG: hypothetical protein ACKVII_11855 [Planctomycetales bacterium]|jgi:hypothetical protein
MTSEDELQKQLNDLAEEQRRRTKPLRTIVVTTFLGGVLTALAVPAIIFLGINGVSLATGIDFVDSMLYSTGGGLLAIGVASIIWSIPGAFAGTIFGCLYSAYSAIVLNPRRHQDDKRSV